MRLRNINGEWSLNETNPRTVVANLQKREEFPGIEALEVVTPPGTSLKLGIVGLVSKQIADGVKDPEVRFTTAGEALPDVFKRLDGANPDLRLLLYNGPPADGMQLANSKFNQFDVT